MSALRRSTSRVHLGPKAVCPACDLTYSIAARTYRGVYVPAYCIEICVACYEANADGWHRELERMLLSHLAERQLKVPARLANGLLPRNG